MSAYEAAFETGMFLVLIIIGFFGLVSFIMAMRSSESDYIGGPMG